MKDLRKLVKTALFLALAIIIQSIGRSIPQISQIFVGSMVNCILIITTLICGTFWGALIGIMTPLLAWIIGQLPSPMAPFLPFIIISNIIFIIIFSMIYKLKGSILKYISIIVASLVKFIFLYLSASKFVYLLHIDMTKKILNKLVIMMGLPQFITAFIGGVLALLIFNILCKRKII
ncbi:ECF transporter S component [Clostridium rectalis]|uniref:ECF transporter S component n=1 Tax=Clostridium rectalis TaxID=2040295 RepID=UPI001FAA3B08|nr:ECF transporter S component [Clostridium rectalis]